MGKTGEKFRKNKRRYVPSKEPPHEVVEGIVDFFHDDKGWGFIRLTSCHTETKVFVHRNDIIAPFGNKSLVKGQEVQFMVEVTGKGWAAREVAKN